MVLAAIDTVIVAVPAVVPLPLMVIVLPLTVAFDHRALDMGDMIPFFEKLDEIFANTEMIKEWV